MAQPEQQDQIQALQRLNHELQLEIDTNPFIYCWRNWRRWCCRFFAIAVTICIWLIIGVAVPIVQIRDEGLLPVNVAPILAMVLVPVLVLSSLTIAWVKVKHPRDEELQRLRNVAMVL